MEKQKRKRQGFSLVELLIAIVVLGILAGMLINSGVSAQRKARVTAAMTVLRDYDAAFSMACLTHPGIMTDREEAWGADGTGYTTKAAMERVVTYMNESLEASSQLRWDDTNQRYESVGEDPWGGKFVLTEFPLETETSSGYNPLESGSVAESAMRLAIWATGIDASIEVEKKVSKVSVGLAMEYRNGFTQSYFHGVNDEYRYTDYIVKY